MGSLATMCGREGLKYSKSYDWLDAANNTITA